MNPGIAKQRGLIGDNLTISVKDKISGEQTNDITKGETPHIMWQRSFERKLLRVFITPH